MQNLRRRSRVPIGVAATLAVAVQLLLGAGPTARAADPVRPATPLGFVPGHLLVKYRDDVSRLQAQRIEQRLGASMVDRITPLGVRVLNVAPSSVEVVQDALRRRADVEFAERDAIVAATETTPNDEWWPSQWSPVKTRAPLAWDSTTGSSSIVVAVLDTGVDFTQPDLQGALVPGRDIVNNDADPSDDNGHGTYVAGIVAARSNNTIGVASYCWVCSVMPIKVLGSNGSGSTSAVASGITWAADHGAGVINMSLGSQSSSSTLASAVKYARDRSVVSVASAGNYGTTTPVYPAAYPEVIGVAATDGNDQLYSWSSFGSWVAVSAPGVNLTTGRNGWYGNFAGTSSASPVVAGIAGLVLSGSPGATPSDVEKAIEGSAVPVGSVVAYGRVDAAGAVGATSPSPSPSLSPSPFPSPSPSPSPTVSPTPTVSTATFSGTLSNGRPSRTFDLPTGAGEAEAVLTFTRASSLALDLLLPGGAQAGHAQGPAPVTLTVTVVAGTSQLVVSGATRASFTLTVTYPTP